jgi:hypothetical protein
VLRKRFVIWVFTGLVLAACGAGGTNSSPTQPNPLLEEALPPDVALSVQNEVSRVMGVSLENLQLEQVDKMEWPDSCLGLPQEGDEVCAEVITPGWQLTFNIDGQQYLYRVDETGTVIRLAP